MISRLKDQLAGDKTSYACWCGFRDPQLTGMIARQSFDSIVFDAQHGFHNEDSLIDCIPQVVMAGKAPLVRLPLNRWDMCEKALDYGVLGVIAPMINTGQDAETFAKAAKYPKTGARSYAPRYAAALYGISTEEYVEAAEHCTLSFAQIETEEAYNNLDDILAVDGIDGVLMGPSDFSIFVTGNPVPDAYGSGTIEMIEDVAKRARAAGKHAASFTLQASHANQCRDFGYRLISIAMDGSIVPAGAAASFDGIGQDT